MGTRSTGWLGAMLVIILAWTSGGWAQTPAAPPPSAPPTPSGPLPSAQIYVTDLGNNRIVRVDDMSGAGWTTLGSQGGGTNQFDKPRGIFVDASGRIYVADTGNDRIVRMNDITGAGWNRIGQHVSVLTPSTFHSPVGIAAVSNGDIYVADVNCAMRVDGTMSSWSCLSFRFVLFSARTPEPVLPGGLALDLNSRIYLTDISKHRLVRVDDMGAAGWTVLGSQGSSPMQFATPTGITVDPAGRIYVADSDNVQPVTIPDQPGKDRSW